MSQAYSDPKRADDPHALPDVEVWEDAVFIVTCEHCGEFEVAESIATADSDTWCPSCEREALCRLPKHPAKTAWWYWSCFPGCLPDSNAHGPFATEQEALEDAQQYAEDDDTEDDDIGNPD
jgi:hypothetical protein